MSRETGAGFRPRFFAERVEAGAREISLDAEDSHHVTTVLRLRPGDECEVVLLPTGEVHVGEVLAVGSPVRVGLGVRLEGDAGGARYSRAVWLVQALAKPAAMDYVIAKGAETGASRFLLVQGAGSPRMPEGSIASRMARWRRIAREAAKQSKQVAVPGVVLAGSPDAAIADLRSAGATSLVLQPGAARALDEVVAGIVARPVVALWVGPEGGWSPQEVRHFQSAGLELARLGRSVLRTETAGPVAVALVRLGLGDW
jgi:16S rRNA (uracil1498-N3)-methyltransferase